MALRVHWPKEEALDGKWTAPPAKRRSKWLPCRADGGEVKKNTAGDWIFLASQPTCSRRKLACSEST